MKLSRHFIGFNTKGNFNLACRADFIFLVFFQEKRKQAQDMRGAQDMHDELSPAKCLPLLTWKMQTDNDLNLTGRST